MNWKEVNEYIYRKSTGLMKHENDIHAKKPSHTPKTSARVVFDKSHAVVISDRDRTFYVVSTSVFFEVMHRVLPEATKKYPDYFGKNDAYKVLDAVYNTRPVGTPENFPEFIRREHFAYIFEIKDDKIIDKLLRVDFFRIIENI